MGEETMMRSHRVLVNRVAAGQIHGSDGYTRNGKPTISGAPRKPMLPSACGRCEV